MIKMAIVVIITERTRYDAMKGSDMKASYGLSAFTVVVLLNGCASSSHRELFGWDQPVSLADVVRVDSSPDSHRFPDNIPDLADDVGAEDYVRLALERNPTIRAAEERVRMLAQRIPQVTSLNDPMFKVAPFGEMAETAAGQVGAMTSISQKFPTPGKLKTRGQIAERAVAQQEQELERVKLAVIADTRRSYWNLYFATRAIDITGNHRALIQQFLDIAEAKLRVGAASQPAVLRASVELSNLDNELILFTQRQISAKSMLNNLLNRPQHALIPDPREESLVIKNDDLDTLLGDAATSNPEIQRVRERIEQLRERFHLARLNRLPDMTASVSYNLVDNEGLSGVANGDDQWWVGFGFNLPIWTGRLEAAEQEALRGMLAETAALGNITNRIDYRVRDALARVDSEQQQATRFRDVIIPQAKQTLEASTSGYRAGKIDFLTLIDNWRKLLDFELMYHGSMSRLGQARADLKQAVGNPPADATQPTNSSSSESDPEVNHD